MTPLYAQVPEQMAGDPELREIDLRVFIALSAHARYHSRKAWPRQDTLAAMVGVSRSTVKRSLNRLEERDYIRRYPYRRPRSGQFGTPIYIVAPFPDEDAPRRSESEVWAHVSEDSQDD